MSISKRNDQTPILDVPPDTIGSGKKTVTSAGTAEALSATSILCRRVMMTGVATNTGKVYFGGSSVSATSGAYLFAGQTVTVDIDDVSKVYIDSDVNGEGVQFTYVE